MVVDGGSVHFGTFVVADYLSFLTPPPPTNRRTCSTHYSTVYISYRCLIYCQSPLITLRLNFSVVHILINIDLLHQPSPAPTEQMKLALPTHLQTNGRVCFYGFDVTMEWLIDYARTHWNDADRYDDLAKVSSVIKLLRKRSRIKSLEYESALVDDTVPTDTVLKPGHRPGEHMVPLLTVFNNQKSSYNKRPSQEAMDLLSQIMGGKQPRWWIDYEDPRSYDG
jgi:hypothetical protein